MKKSIVFWVVLNAILILLIVSLLFHILYFDAIRKNLIPASELEKQKTIEILSQNLNLSDYQIKIGDVYN